jgi:hypothetical protein
MAAPVVIQDANGTKKQACVTQDHSLLIVAQSFPTLDPQKIRPFRSFFVDSGDSEDMSVDGSGTPIDFTISASEEDDRYITQISFILGYGTSAYLYQFADGAELTNGIRIFYTAQAGDNEVVAITKNYDLLRARRGQLTVDWQARNFNAINDWGYMGTINLTDNVPPYGIKLDRRSRQKLVIRIQDNLTGVADLFNFIGIGFDRFEL